MRKGLQPDEERTMTEVHVPRAAAAEGAGSGIGDRLRAVEAGLVRLETRFETEMKHVATRVDLERHFNRLLRWGWAS